MKLIINYRGGKKMYEDLTAKEMLNKLLEKHYSDAMEAKEAGRPVGWVASNFPQEFISIL